MKVFFLIHHYHNTFTVLAIIYLFSITGDFFFKFWLLAMLKKFRNFFDTPIDCLGLNVMM